jgi:protein-S-isoprenylcysteine O-methyltransferase Ste14
VNLEGLRRPGVHGRWMLVVLLPFALVLARLPAYTDRREIRTLDGDAVRYLGVVVLTIGVVPRVGPMSVLGRRFTWPLATQEHHPFMTTRFYRYIQHPSCLGALLGMVGWMLVFRSGIGLILVVLLMLMLAGVIPQEEALLKSGFGEAYTGDPHRTWRLVPFLYGKM